MPLGCKNYGGSKVCTMPSLHNHTLIHTHAHTFCHEQLLCVRLYVYTCVSAALFDHAGMCTYASESM